MHRLYQRTMRLRNCSQNILQSNVSNYEKGKSENSVTLAAFRSGPTAVKSDITLTTAYCLFSIHFREHFEVPRASIMLHISVNCIRTSVNVGRHVASFIGVSQYLLQAMSHWRAPPRTRSCCRLPHTPGSGPPWRLSPARGHSPHAAHNQETSVSQGQGRSERWRGNSQIRFIPIAISIWLQSIVQPWLCLWTRHFTRYTPLRQVQCNTHLTYNN